MDGRLALNATHFQPGSSLTEAERREPNAAYFGLKSLLYRSGAARAARQIAESTPLLAGGLAPYRFKVSGIRREPLRFHKKGKKVFGMVCFCDLDLRC